MKRLLDVVALGGAMIGSVLLAANISISGYGYVFFLASSIAGMFLLRKSNASRAMFWQMVFFTGMNLFGIVRWLF